MDAQPSKYLNRELSWLEFNQRVLDEAREPSVPLLERVRFLSITASNLDEFFMVRVGGLQILAAQGRGKADPAGLTPHEQLRAIRQRIRRMTADQYACYLDLEPKLAEAGIRRLQASHLADRQRIALEHRVDEEIFSILTPMAIPAGGEFPLLGSRVMTVCVRLAADPKDPSGQSRFALIPMTGPAPRFISLPAENGYEYMLLEDVLALCSSRFFPGETVEECVPFRITRNADLGVREDLAFDLLQEMEQVLDARKHSDCIRLELAEPASKAVRDFLKGHLEVSEEDVYDLPGPLGLPAWQRLAELEEFSPLRYPAWVPQASPYVDPRGDIFEVLARQDLLLYHPYESYEPVLQLIEDAADDPHVLAIKQILYRTSRNSPVVAALRRAAANGKHVTVLVELKARFDEARNIGWARDLEQDGVQVIYGVKGLKTHAKLCLVVRREPQGIQRYVHFGTGNYNEITARLYTDASFMSSQEELGADAASFFNAISGYSQPMPFRQIAAAPLGLREKLLEMIEVEKELKRQGRRASITLKLNALSDPAMIEALYSASQAGVKVRLNVRGICCLRPGVPGLSENITVVSIIDRFLEHSRILHFHHGGDERVFISSADWMTRNLDRRLELLVPVEDATCRARLVAILEACFQDTVKARVLQPDGTYESARPAGRRRVFRSQEALYQAACEAVQNAQQTQRTILEPHRAPEPRPEGA